MLDYCLLLEVLATRTTCHNASIFSMNVKVLLEIRDLFEAFFTAKDGASVGFFPGVRPHMIEQALDPFEELAAPRLIARVVGHSLRYLVGATTRHLVVAVVVDDLSLKPELAKNGGFRHRMPLAYLLQIHPFTMRDFNFNFGRKRKQSSGSFKECCAWIVDLFLILTRHIC